VNATGLAVPGAYPLALICRRGWAAELKAPRRNMPNPLIRKLERLYSLSDEEKNGVLEIGSRVIEIGPRQDIVRDGDRPSDCKLILEGFACRYKLMPEGKRQIMSFHIGGDIVDLHSLLLERMDYCVATVTRCKVSITPHQSVLELIENHPRIGRALWKDTLIDAAIFREWMASIGRRSAYQRIAHLMCELATRMDAVRLEKGSSYDWPITQSELGDALGLSTVHVNRTLQELRADGLITLRGSTLVIHSRERLANVGEFTPEYLHLASTDSAMVLNRRTPAMAGRAPPG
jgi:CRP-like cAMP-binding protein